MKYILSSPLTSTPNLLSTLEQFASLSGLAVNPQESKALNGSLPQPIVSHLHHTLPFSWSPHSIPSLGIKLTADPAALFLVNYLLKLTHLTSHMTAWSTLPLAWLGSLAVTKMTTLPEILYLFQVLPQSPHLDMGQN